MSLRLPCVGGASLQCSEDADPGATWLVWTEDPVEVNTIVTLENRNSDGVVLSLPS